MIGKTVFLAVVIDSSSGCTNNGVANVLWDIALCKNSYLYFVPVNWFSHWILTMISGDGAVEAAVAVAAEAVVLSAAGVY